MEDREIRSALDLHWAASDANDFEVEHQIYRDDAVLEYPQSGERIRGQVQHLGHLHVRMERTVWHALVQAGLRLASLRHRLTAGAPDLAQEQTLQRRITQRLTTAMEQFLERRHAGLVRLDAHLNALSPQQVLQRGYSIVSRLDGHIVQDGAQLAPGDDVTMTFARGSARATVNSSRS
jgi:exonuclease VII large subunit